MVVVLGAWPAITAPTVKKIVRTVITVSSMTVLVCLIAIIFGMGNIAILYAPSTVVWDYVIKIMAAACLVHWVDMEITVKCTYYT